MLRNTEDRDSALDQQQIQLPLKNQRSEDFLDETHQYRIVKLCEKAIKKMKRYHWENKLLTERQWRSLEIEQTSEWKHYSIFDKEPFVLLFKKPLKKD